EGALKIILTVLGIISLALGVFLLLKNQNKYEKTEKRRDFISGVPIGVIACVFVWIVGLVG
ncbi:MAG: hypothetical protein J6Q38_00325, partial [Clostridia bacterium]|nr:hypothetical protein [Clostridia bacterium]